MAIPKPADVEAPAKIGLVGIGLLGTAIAERWLHSGRQIVGFDSSVRQREALTALGGHAVSCLDQVYDNCRCVVLSLPHSDIVREVIAELHGRYQPAWIVDTTTGHPHASVEIGEQLARQGISYLDATVAGSSDEVRLGRAIAMVGGPAAAYEALPSLWSCLFQNAYYLGPWGSGARMKLVVNLVLGLNRAVLAEGLAFANALDLDLYQTLEVLSVTVAYSRAMDTKGQKMIRRDFAPQARLAQHLKDVRLIRDMASEAAQAVPFSTLHQELLESLLARGFGDADNAAIIEWFNPSDSVHGPNP